MKKLHSFDEVFDGQKVFRKILEAVSNPGRRVSIREQAEKMYGGNAVFLAIAMTLLDNEVTFCACGDKELSANISLITLSKEVSVKEADFIFVEGEKRLEEAFEKAKCGTLEDPQKSATFIIKAEDAHDTEIVLYGAGIDGTLCMKAPDITEKAIELRTRQNYEYPQGIDMVFAAGNGELFCIPRLVKKKEGQ